MGAVLHRDEVFTERRVARVVNLYSAADKVARRAPGFGDAGWWGFARDVARGYPLGRIRNVDMTPLEHGDYTRPGRAWDAIIEELALYA